jgi:DNA ligase 1
MHDFALLLDRLYYTASHLAKLTLLKNYFAKTKDPERGYALAVIAGELNFPSFKRSIIKELIVERTDPYLFELSYDYIGDLSETVALLWPSPVNSSISTLPSLTNTIDQLNVLSKIEIKDYLANLLNQANAIERWALLKLGTGGLRIGVSTRFLKQALALYGNKDIHDIEHIWHAIKPPYQELFAWLEGKSSKPDMSNSVFFHPVMLSHPLDDSELVKIEPQIFSIERKYDGIRVQLIITPNGKALYTRTGDDISSSFPDILEHTHSTSIVLDGELVIQKQQQIGSFNDLQQRLNRKKPNKKLLEESPAFIILYDILSLQGIDLRKLSFSKRRKQLEIWFQQHKPERMMLSEILFFDSAENLLALKDKVLEEKNIAVEGLMIKRKDSSYIAGRPTGLWYKWKRDPLLVDAVLMYAQRGHGKRSSYYSDYTFGLWREQELLPIGKAYFGFTDAELLELDKWIRHHTIGRFGPVREVEKSLVFEIAFDSVNYSSRHKSGVALRFPRIHRIRWDKPAVEADTLEALNKWIK